MEGGGEVVESGVCGEFEEWDELGEGEFVERDEVGRGEFVP